jgi:starvation-inducible DNA-binding protein
MATTTKFVSSHAALVTPTDLKTGEVSAIAESVNPLIADTFALFVKTKNYHLARRRFQFPRLPSLV